MYYKAWSLISVALLSSSFGGCSVGTESIEVAGVAQAVDSSRLYGTYCQEDFEMTWRETLPGTWSTCSNFNSAMNNLSPRSFYYNLHGAAWHFDQSGDQEDGGGLDGVDLVFVSTHGGAWTSPDQGTLTMYEQNSRAFTTDMRLGDENRGLSLFAMHSCETLKFSGLNNRWTAAFDGGLRIAVGSHDKIFFNTSNTGDGTRFANNMGAGQVVRDAWKNSLSGYSLDQDAAVVATGANNSNCFSRLDGIKWSTLTSTSRLMDAAWQTICQRQWDNL